MMLASLRNVQDIPPEVIGALAVIVALAGIGILPPLRAPRGIDVGDGHGPAAPAVLFATTRWHCVHCETKTPLDDVAEWVSGDTGVCLRCLGLLTGTVRPMPTALEQELRATEAEVSAP